MEKAIEEFLIFIFGLTFYLLPWIASCFRHHKAKLKIFLVNFFLGWTGACWLVALVWACNDDVNHNEESRK